MKVDGGIAAAAVAVVVLGGSGLAVLAVGDDGSGSGKGPTGADSAAEASGKDDTETETPDEPAGPDPLCVAHDERAAAVAAVIPADSPAKLEAYVMAQLAFYAGAAGSEAEPEASAFRAMADYFEATRAFYESLSWTTPDTIDEISRIPQLPADGASERSAQILSERCGITLTTDRPAAP